MVNCASQASAAASSGSITRPRRRLAAFPHAPRLIMVDGKPLSQSTILGSFPRCRTPTGWGLGLKFVVRLKDNGDPRDHVVTYTCRDQLFVPANPYRLYRVRAWNLNSWATAARHAKGALSTLCATTGSSRQPRRWPRRRHRHRHENPQRSYRPSASAATRSCAAMKSVLRRVRLAAVLPSEPQRKQPYRV
jgi:hypothetical protein